MYLRIEPRASPARSWDWESIDSYLNGNTKTQSLAAIAQDVLAALRQAVWLPYDEDYVVLALTAIVTHIQTVFESVPLILMNGPAGSGKTQAGATMAKLSANGTVIGQTSAATAASVIESARKIMTKRRYALRELAK
jgi:phage terminase large subunit-like protein